MPQISAATAALSAGRSNGLDWAFFKAPVGSSAAAASALRTATREKVIKTSTNDLRGDEVGAMIGFSLVRDGEMLGIPDCNGMAGGLKPLAQETPHQLMAAVEGQPGCRCRH